MMVTTCSVPPYSCRGICSAFRSKRPWRCPIPGHPFKIPAHKIPMGPHYTHLIIFTENRGYERLLGHQDVTLSRNHRYSTGTLAESMNRIYIIAI